MTPSRLRLVLVAACALIDPDGRVLVAQRPPGKRMAGLWEFPGGKVEPGERPEETVIREFQEELGITISEPCLAPFTFASHTYPDFQLLMPLYVCRRWEGTATAIANIVSQRVLERNSFVRTGTTYDPDDGELIWWRRDLFEFYRSA